MAAGISIPSGGFAAGWGWGLSRSQVPALPLSEFLGGKHGVLASPVVPEVKMYRHVSITLWGADRYPGTGSSTSADSSASKSLIPAGCVSGPAAHRRSPMALKAGRSASRDSTNSGCGGKAQLRFSACRHPQAFPTP